MSSLRYTPGETRPTTGADLPEQDWHRQHNGTDGNPQGDFGQTQAGDNRKRDRNRDEEPAGQQIPGKPISDMDPPGQDNH